MKTLWTEAASFFARNRHRRIWKRIVGTLACMVVVCTTYALILPAVTLEGTEPCGLESHMHSAACYDLRAENDHCALELHRHTAACRDGDDNLICGYADFVIHRHNEFCYDQNQNLVCLLEELTEEEIAARIEEMEATTGSADDPLSSEPGGSELGIETESEGSSPSALDFLFSADSFLDGALDSEGDSLREAAKAAAELESAEAEGQEEYKSLLHQHDDTCFDENGRPICGRVQLLEHEHTADCFDQSVLSCQLEEHSHSEACQVIGLMAALPDRQSVEAELEELTGNEAGQEEYLAELRAQVQAAYEAYAALSAEEQEKVTNLERLEALEWLFSLAQGETAGITVTNGPDSVAAVSAWHNTASSVTENIETALRAVEPGYTRQDAQYYQIAGLTGDTATVTYTDGGLSAEDNAKLFVFDLGPASVTTPSSCTMLDTSDITKQGTQPDLFESFCFAVPENSKSEPHIYAFVSATPAEQEESGLVAYDADKNVKATVTLPEGATAPEGYQLYIRKIENENIGEAVKAKVGAINDWQCYDIGWSKQATGESPTVLANIWQGSEPQTLPLNQIEKDRENATITVKIDYLNETARLAGPAGARKLLIFNSDEQGALVEQVADTVTNVTVDNTGYTSFTFEAAHSGPYVFVSKKLEMGFIDALAIASIVDGTAPFDNTDTPGNDSGGDNRIVRSYDTIQYNLEATFAARQAGVVKPDVNLYFELTLAKSATAARFDVNKMVWLGENYSIEYLDRNDNVIMIMAHDGKYYKPQMKDGNVVRDEHGFALADTTRPVSMNAQVSGSGHGANSYKVLSSEADIAQGVAKQRLVGCTKVFDKKGNVLSGTQTFSAAVEVRNADAGEIFAPTFKMWLEGNEENYGSEGKEGAVMLPAQPDQDNVVDINDEKNKDYRVTVSAGTNFNLQLKKNNDMSYKNWFDFSTGQAVEEPTRTELERLANLEENHGKSNPAEFTKDEVGLPQKLKEQYRNYRYGRITCYGITLQLYNDTDNEPDKNRASKGLKGMSLPVGDITFDLNFASEVRQGSTALSGNQYPAILWDYNENVPANSAYSYTYQDPGRGTVTTPKDGLGNGGRNLYWDGETRSPYAKGGGPSNYIAYHDGCYYGGDWALVNETGQKITNIGDIANPTQVTGTGANTTYHFSVSDYDFDFDEQHFPTKDAGNSGTVTGYDTYARCFSAGCVQVLSVFPRVQQVSEAEVFLNTKVSNLHLTTRAGQELKAADDDDSKIQHEVNKSDNIKRDQIVLYAPGKLTKGSAFNGKYYDTGKKVWRDPVATNTGFLGTEYWTTSYDCSTFAGDDIWITSYGMMNSGSDYRMRSMNLLQLFDSRALRIRGNPDVIQNCDPAFDQKGKATFLYAADPEHPEGYDTNKDGVLAYMNSVREEDLVYSTGVPDTNGNITVNGEKMKCVGVLMELRHCDLLGGKYQYMRIPVKVNGDDKGLVGKTVATVNTFRVWSWDLDDISWANGQWNGKTNELDGFPKPQNAIVDENYSGELANSKTSSPPYYVKTEYADGHQMTGTHAGGTLAGNSLLILSYKAHVGIDVINKGDGESGTISYNLTNGETVVDYQLKNIRTEVSDLTNQPVKPTTTLTIRAVLDEGYTGDQRIAISGNSYHMQGYAVNADGTVASAETNVAISSDPQNPTKLAFVGSDRNQYTIEIHAVPEAGNKAVKFVIANAPVGLQLPNITFQANLMVTALENNDTIKANAYISGEGDNRAYAEAQGNAANTVISIVKLGGTNLLKAVDLTCIELNGDITYTVTYTNSGTATIPKLYLYDLLPYVSDDRGSQFAGKVELTAVQIETQASYDAYYSMTDSTELYQAVTGFSGKAANTVDDMLNNSDMFKHLDIKDIPKTATCLYLTVSDLAQGQTVTLQFKVHTNGNEANDWYKNVANSWIADSATLPLKSNQVETQTVSRSISGVVWFDKNLNGIREDNEPLLKDVTATLFKKGKNGYECCTEDVTGGEIASVITGADGAYSFDKLAAGDYIVAFSGDVLKQYTGATTYQQGSGNQLNTNDGKAISELTAAGIDKATYSYYICYSVGSASMLLHSLDQMGTVTLVNGVESYVNQDLGLMIATPELPETGGPGAAPYMMGGLLLMTMSAASLRFRRKR